MKPFVPSFVLAALVLGGCSDPKKTIIPSDVSTWETTLKPTLEKLPDEDRQTVGRYMIRAKMGETFGGKSKLGTITVGEAIKEQKDFEAERKAKDDEEKRLADDLRAKQDALARQVRETLSVVMVSKGFYKADPMNGGGFQDKVTFTLGFQNKGSKPIAGFKGDLVFKDMFGDTIKALNFSHDEAVPAGKTVTWEGSMDFNEFMRDDVRLRDADESKVKLEFKPETILFADGSKLEMPVSSE